jgi:hypothetical protein
MMPRAAHRVKRNGPGSPSRFLGRRVLPLRPPPRSFERWSCRRRSRVREMSSRSSFTRHSRCTSPTPLLAPRVGDERCTRSLDTDPRAYRFAGARTRVGSCSSCYSSSLLDEQIMPPLERTDRMRCRSQLRLPLLRERRPLARSSSFHSHVEIISAPYETQPYAIQLTECKSIHPSREGGAPHHGWRPAQQRCRAPRVAQTR